MTAASDVHALTAVLVECLGGVPAELEAIVARGTARRQGQRYRTAGELLEACTTVLADLPGAALDRAPKRPLREGAGAITSLQPDGVVSWGSGAVGETDYTSLETVAFDTE